MTIAEVVQTDRSGGRVMQRLADGWCAALIGKRCCAGYRAKADDLPRLSSRRDGLHLGTIAIRSCGGLAGEGSHRSSRGGWGGASPCGHDYQTRHRPRRLIKPEGRGAMSCAPS